MLTVGKYYFTNLHTLKVRLSDEYLCKLESNSPAYGTLAIELPEVST